MRHLYESGTEVRRQVLLNGLEFEEVTAQIVLSTQLAMDELDSCLHFVECMRLELLHVPDVLAHVIGDV
jgi:hypothetical protein